MEYFNAKRRWIEEPKRKLKAVQKRFSLLLGQIKTPEYLHSAVRKRSYVSNARQHTVDLMTVKADVKAFYLSARSAEVFHFLTDVLEWEKDVAGLTVKLLTWKGHLPTGSSASPILSFWVYKHLFDAIDEMARSEDCIFTLYVDDITISGKMANRALLGRTRKLIGGARLRAHKMRVYPRKMPRLVTGVAQTVGGLKLPYQRRKLLDEAVAKMADACTLSEQSERIKPLLGRLCEAAEIDPVSWLAKRDKAIQKQKDIGLACLAESKFADSPMISGRKSARAPINPASLAFAPWEDG